VQYANLFGSPIAHNQNVTWFASPLCCRFGHHPLFAKLRGVNLTDNPVTKKASELADDIREKYETSDHPAVHKVEVSEAAQSFPLQ
jgi:hypothetical protein